MTGVRQAEQPLYGAVIGSSVTRREDARLLRGEGVYLDDLDDRDGLHAAFVRSPLAHAEITGVDRDAARAAPGVVEVFTAHDLGPLLRPLPLVSPHPDLIHGRSPFPLASDRVRFVGEPVAMVLAEDRYLAEDACELVDVGYNELPAAVDLERASQAGTPLVHDDVPCNRAARCVQRVGHPDEAFAAAPLSIRRRFVIERSAGMPLETRGVIASFRPRIGELEVWDSTQVPTMLRQGLAELLGLDVTEIRVATPDVGGGFGTKVMVFYPEEVLIPWAAIQLGRTVKWTEDRAEHFVGSHHERKQIHDIELAADTDGRVLGLRDHFLHDNGAYASFGLDVPVVSASQIAGGYRIPHLEVSFDAIYTNTTQVSPYRGCGRPHACVALELAMDCLADQLGLDRMELRRRNFIAPDEFPYRRDGLSFADHQTVVLDSGNYAAGLDRVLDALEYNSFASEQLRAREQGRYIGLGLACYVEATGMGPYDGARVWVEPGDGRIHVAAGVATAGQSHATVLAQIVSQVLDVPVETVAVVTGDSAAFAKGAGAYASRSAVVAGNAVHRAATSLRTRALQLGAALLGANLDEVELVSGRVRVRSEPDRAVALAQIAASADPLAPGPDTEDLPAGEANVLEGPPLPDGTEPGLDIVAYYSPPGATWASGVHGARIEIDPETFEIRFEQYVCVHDCGTAINPMVVEGQVLGGIAQGIAGALYERLVYDEQGQLRNASLMDFLMPYATEIPAIECHHIQTPSALNELGIKGVGEAGVIAPAAVVLSAVRDALKHLGVELAEVPLSPALLHDAVSSARAPERSR